MSKVMYELKPIISLPNIVGTFGGMYALKNLHSPTTQSNSDSSQEVDSSEIQALDDRQKRILKQLEELKEQVAKLWSAIKQPLNENSSQSIFQNSDNFDSINAEIILHANPDSPPYSLLAIKKIWTNIDFNIQFYKHSTIRNQETSSFENLLSKSENLNCKHRIQFIVIWKKVQELQFLTKMNDYPFTGEINFLRYMCRLIKNYNFETIATVNQSTIIDSTLDICHKIINSTEQKSTNSLILKLANNLNKNSWLSNCNNNNQTIVDIATWTAIKKINKNQVPKDIKNWFDICEKKFL